MIPNVSRGDRMTGLLAYLAGPGRHNEHTDPHVIAGSSPVMAWWSDMQLDRSAIADLGRHLDAPRTTFDVQVKQGHVWHCSLSIASDEGPLSDTQWQAIADRFMDGMGFTDETKAPVRWVGIRHGVSSGGNDHIHLAVQWVREDGTRCFIKNDYQRSQQVAREIEAEFGLQRVGADTHHERAYKPGEREAAARREARAAARDRGEEWASLSTGQRTARTLREMAQTPPRAQLSLSVRAAAVASLDEGEFVRRLRAAGLIVRPRYARGTTDVIDGYSVAQRPATGEAPVWYGGGTLAHDLTLPKLRELWTDTPHAAAAAAAEWGAAARRRRPVAPGREATEPTADDWTRATRRLAELHDQLSSTPQTDVGEWARVARQLGGATAAWARRVEPGTGPLTDAALALGRCAQVRHTPPRRPAAPNLSLANVAATLIGASRRGAGPAAQAALALQLVRLTTKLYAAHQAANDYRRSQALIAAAHQQLQPFAARMRTADASNMSAAAYASSRPGTTVTPRGAGQPVSQPLRPAAPVRQPTRGINR